MTAVVRHSHAVHCRPAVAAAGAAAVMHAGHCLSLVRVADKHTWHHGHVTEVDCEQSGGGFAVSEMTVGSERAVGFHSHSAGFLQTWVSFGRSPSALSTSAAVALEVVACALEPDDADQQVAVPDDADQ